MDKVTGLRLGSRLVSMVAVLPHLFTCVLPAVASVLSATGVAAAVPGLLNLPGMGFLQAHNRELLVVATVAALVGVISHFWKWACPCGPNCTCTACSCQSRGWVSWGSFGFSCLMVLLVGWMWWTQLTGAHAHHEMMMHDMAHPGMEMPAGMNHGDMMMDDMGPMDHDAMGHGAMEDAD